MPRYQITAPDGREVVIEGERPPTQEDALKIFAQLPPKSTTEKKGIPHDTLGAKKKPAAAEVDKQRDVGGVLADIALEGGGATAGQALGALAAPYTFGASIPIGGAIGGLGGNLASQKRRILAGEQKGYRAGEALASVLTGAIPGASLESAGAKSIAREALKQGAGGVAGRTVETVIDESRLPSLTEVAITGTLPAVAGAAAQRMQSANPEISSAVAAANAADKTGATKRASLKAAQEIGAAVPPSDVNDSFINKRLESLAGPADVRRGAQFKNQVVGTAAAVEELGLPKGTEITIPVLNQIRANAAAPYAEIGALADSAKSQVAAITKSATSPHDLAIKLAAIPDVVVQAKADIGALNEARATMNANRPPYPQSDPARLEVFRSARDQVDALEKDIEAAAIAAGRPELVPELKASRTLIAKSHDVERTLNPGDSSVSIPTLGSMIDKGRPLSGGLATMGNFALSFPRAVAEGAKIQPFGLSKTEAITGGLLAGAGITSTGDPRMALLGLVPPIASGTARRLVLSAPYQRVMANLPAPIVNASPEKKAMIARVLAQEAAQEIADETKPEKKK